MASDNSGMRTLLPLQLLVAPDRNDPDPLVLYHGKGCPDGFAAALAAWTFYEGRVQCLGLDHGQVQTVADLPPLRQARQHVLQQHQARGEHRDHGAGGDRPAQGPADQPVDVEQVVAEDGDTDRERDQAQGGPGEDP